MFKKILLAFFVATTGLAINSVAVAAPAAETAAGVKQALVETINHVKAGIAAAKANDPSYKDHIKGARQTSKEINSGGQHGAKLQMADEALARAVKASKNDDAAAAASALEEALAVYSKL